MHNDDLFFDFDAPQIVVDTAKAPYARCSECPLADRPFVPSYLPKNSIAVVIGEAPGAEEVHGGQPFIGRSGRLLTDELLALRVCSDRVARLNACCCRPIANTTPSKEAIAACSERLRHEINQTHGTIITCGTTPMQALDLLRGVKSKRKVLTSRGRWETFEGRSVMPTIHPAYVLRKPDAVKDLRADLARVFDIEAPTTVYDTQRLQHTVVTPQNIGAVITYLDAIPQNYLVAIDVETDDLQWYDTLDRSAAQLLCLSISCEPYKALVIPPAMLIVLRATVQALFDRCAIVAHNGKYETAVLTRAGFSVKIAVDTMLQHYVLDETKGTHGLKYLVQTVLQCRDDYETRLVDSWFAANKVKKDDRRYGMLPKADLYLYCAIDTNATLALTKVFTQQLHEAQLYNVPFKSVLMPVMNALAKVEQNGILVDVPYLQKARVTLQADITTLRTQIAALVLARLTEFIENGNIRVPKGIDWIKTRATYAGALEKCYDINLNSWQQVQVILYDVLGLKHTQKLGYKTDPRSTNEEALLSLQLNDTSGFVEALMQYRRLAKILGTYVEKLLTLADVNGRVHINYLVHGTEIGRLSASDAMHGIPRPSDVYGQMIRGAFIAAPGNKLVIADYSQAEFRTFAALSKEPTLLNAYAEGREAHDETARAIAEAVKGYFKWDYRDPNIPPYIKKEIRTLAKNINFGEIYGGSASGITAMLGGKIDVQTVQRILDAKRANQPIAAQWKFDIFRLAREQGYVQSRFGRIRRFPLIVEENLDEIRKACVHFLVASEASDLTLLSIVELIKRGFAVVGTWHDSIVIECREDLAETIALAVEMVMVDTGNTYIDNVPWQVDVEIQDRWYEDRPNL